MARVHFWQFIINEEGQPVEGANISVYAAGSTTPLTLYTSEAGSGTVSSPPQLQTNADGFFQFWLGDTVEENGYPRDLKMRLRWESPGIETGDIDHVDIFSGYLEVELGDSSSERNKTVSNLLATSWENHKNSQEHIIHGIREVNPVDTNTKRNKTVSNLDAKGWEDHKNSPFGDEPHGLEPVDEWDTSPTVNKLVSNALLNSILTDYVHTATVAIGDWVASGESYYYDIGHGMNDDWPIVQIYSQSTRMVVVPQNIESIDVDTTRIWMEEPEAVKIKLLV